MEADTPAQLRRDLRRDMKKSKTIRGRLKLEAEMWLSLCVEVELGGEDAAH